MRLIDAKALERNVKEAFKENPFAMGMLLRWIRKQPTIEARPVVRGEWVDLGRNYYTVVSQCSECGAKYDFRSPYCPNCGADMRGDDDGK